MIKFLSCFLIIICINTLTGCTANRSYMFMKMQHGPVNMTLVNITKNDYNIFDSQGNPADLPDIINAAGFVDTVFIGESHGDPCAHFLELNILENLYKCYQKENKGSIIISMEMFERDVQPVIDEYMKDLITEKHFLSASRPWPGYMKNYRAIVEFAKKNNIPLIAANAPSRYVNRVSRLGKEALNDLSENAKNRWLPPLPYEQASEKYRKKFKKFWENIPAHNNMNKNPENNKAFQNFIDAQSLWDASMAFSIKNKLEHKHNRLVININGIFHSSQGLGVPEHLLKYMPKINILTISIISGKNFPNFDNQYKDYGDFIIFTNPELQEQ